MVTDYGNEDSETAILQFPHRLVYSLDLHMLDCDVPWCLTFFAWVFWGRNDKIDEKERHESSTNPGVWNLALWCHVMRTRPETQKQDKISALLLPYSARMRIFVSCFVRGLLCSKGFRHANLPKDTRRGYMKVRNCGKAQRNAGTTDREVQI